MVRMAVTTGLSKKMSEASLSLSEESFANDGGTTGCLPVGIFFDVEGRIEGIPFEIGIIGSKFPIGSSSSDMSTSSCLSEGSEGGIRSRTIGVFATANASGGRHGGNFFVVVGIDFGGGEEPMKREFDIFIEILGVIWRLGERPLVIRGSCRLS